MHIIKSAQKLSHYLSVLRIEIENVTVGFTPTMGALHVGHISLINASVENNDITICSIFVNPTQFGDQNDLDKYPKPIEKDIALLIENKCDILFLPSYEDVYPKEYEQKEFDLAGLDFKIEGASRPGHFQGVSNVISRFFEIIEPTNAYFGQKDYQQTVVVKRLIKILKLPVILNVEPIKREPHGLAMSSRNIRLSEKGRKNAAFINEALKQLKEDVPSLGITAAVTKAKQFISAQKGARVDYLLAVDTTTLDSVDKYKGKGQTAVVTVVEYEGVRLLDNIIL